VAQQNAATEIYLNMVDLRRLTYRLSPEYGSFEAPDLSSKSGDRLQLC